MNLTITQNSGKKETNPKHTSYVENDNLKLTVRMQCRFGTLWHIASCLHTGPETLFSCSAQKILSGEIYTKTLLLFKKKIGFDGWKQDFRTATYLGCEPTLSPFDQAAAEP